MKKINYVLNENNQIVSYSEIPFDENKPFIEVSNDDKMIPGTVVKLVNSKVDFEFKMHHHTYCWKYYPFKISKFNISFLK